MQTNEIENVQLPDEIRSFIQENQPRYPTPRGVLIPALMECQKRFGQVTPGLAMAVSEETGVAFSEVQSVVSFYTMLLEQPVGKYVIAGCCTWNCEFGGAPSLVEHFKKKYSCELGDVVADGCFTMFKVECLADCHNAPSLQFLKIGHDFKACWVNNLTIELFETILEDLKAGRPDALRERLVRIDEKLNPPDDKQWIWLVTTNNHYPAWVETRDGDYLIHDGFGKLANLKLDNPALYEEISAALKAK